MLFCCFCFLFFSKEQPATQALGNIKLTGVKAAFWILPRKNKQAQKIACTSLQSCFFSPQAGFVVKEALPDHESAVFCLEEAAGQRDFCFWRCLHGQNLLFRASLWIPLKWQLPKSNLLANAFVWLDTYSWKSAQCDVTKSNTLIFLMTAHFKWGEKRKVWQSSEWNKQAFKLLFSKAPAVLLCATCCILYIASLNQSNEKKKNIFWLSF